MRSENFRARQFNKNTILIEGTGSIVYLLLGKDKALLVDSGMSRGNLHKFVEEWTQLPVSVVNTHGHDDHIMGNIYFDTCYMHPEAIIDARYFFEEQDDTFLKGYSFNPQSVTEGFIFDLGGRTVEVIEIPCHSPGDIALLDYENRLLFTGDNLEAGQILLFYGDAHIGASVFGHYNIMKKLEKYYDNFDYICPAHNGSPVYKTYLKRVLKNDEIVLNGMEGTAELFSPSFGPDSICPIDYNYVRCSEYKGTTIIYDNRRIYTSEGLWRIRKDKNK